MNYQTLLSTTFIACTFFANAQTSSRTYAITGKQNNTFFWADIKQVDIATGKVVKTLFDADKTPFKVINGDNAKAGYVSAPANPTGFGVAACAFDVVHNRLYFAPMHFSDIYYLDLNKPDANFTKIQTKAFTTTANAGYQPEESQITRMVIAADGNGYALTNDANHLIRFSTGKKNTVEDLGPLIDGAENKGLSIHNKCSSWGGDMVADAFGKLVVVSASHNIFSIDVNTKSASLKGPITGLPANFTTNGAAVDAQGNMVVSSANVFDALYTVNMKDFSATRIVSAESPFNASDLANGNLLSQKEADAANIFPLLKTSQGLDDAKIFPNPVSGSQFKVLFTNRQPGAYTIMLTDISGAVLQSKVVSIAKGSQTETVNLNRQQAKGTYFVNVIGADKKIAFKQKLILD